MTLLQKIVLRFSNSWKFSSTEASFTSNGRSSWCTGRRFGYFGLSLGCATFLWKYWKNDTHVVCESEFKEHSKSVPLSVITGKTRNGFSLDDAIKQSQDIMVRHKDVTGAPGIAICVTVNGRSVWSQGFGYSDLENRTACTADTVMRIASISKSITMAVVAKLWESGMLDLDKPVQEYVPNFPKKKVDGQSVDITCRHLLSHMSGIRHYLRKEDIGKEHSDLEMQAPEFLLKEKFASVNDSLKLFQDDELIHKPGEKYLYTTHGWTLVSAILEKVLNEPFCKHMTKVFQQLGMKETYLDTHEPIISNWARYYVKSKSGNIQNAPYVDNSYKWAGGGFLSTVRDLVNFGNIMLYSYQHDEQCSGLPGYIKKDTVVKMWTMVEKTENYGMGWKVGGPNKEFGGGPQHPFYATHTGGAVGASSILYILPQEAEPCIAPSGVVVAILTNLPNVSFSKPAKEIAQLFSEASLH